MRYVLKIAYDGTAYAGWQRQKNALSVQEALETAIQTALGVDVRVTASGRFAISTAKALPYRLKKCPIA